ncbi:hypothetical protein JTB14_011337 [Gonioctena quinquepunctata]|nr:hypothetical protein JTB14_011337 [Gonioctena quinquepunctata]
MCSSRLSSPATESEFSDFEIYTPVSNTDVAEERVTCHVHTDKVDTTRSEKSIHILKDADFENNGNADSGCSPMPDEEVLNFARHIQRNHSHEPEVAKIMYLDPKSKERKDLICILRKRGNYIRNMNGLYKPVRSPLLKDRSSLPCSRCLGFYSSKLFYRHRKYCMEDNTGNAQVDGQNTLINNLSKRIDSRLKNEVFPRIMPDKVNERTCQDSYSTEKKGPKIKNLFQFLQPKYFDLICDSAKIVAQYDSVKDLYTAPTYAKNIGTSLKQCCDIAIRLNLTQQSSISTAETEVNLKNMIHLFTTSWRFEVSSQAGSDLNMKKWNKVTIVPLAEDLEILKQYLIGKATDAVKSLTTDPHDKEAFTVLLETIYCRIILLNRKRPGELQRLFLHTYLSCESKEEGTRISKGERGKRGRGVPVLFSKDVQEHISVLLSVRNKQVDDKNSYLFGKPGLVTPKTGYKVLQSYARASGAKNPSSITCTKLRKHLATLSQLFSLNETEIDQLATFMGHTIGVHRNSYRLPDDLHQTAKISKILLLLESGNLGEYKGKNARRN